MEPKKTALFIGGSRGIGRAFALEAMRRNIQAIAVARQFRTDDPVFDAATKIIADIATPEGRAILRRAKIWHVPYVFWTPGSYFQGRLTMTADRNIDRMLTMQMGLLMKFVRDFQLQRVNWQKEQPPESDPPGPYTLVVMGSMSSCKHRKYESVYAGAKAGQAQFLRTFAAELAEDFPGSRVLLVNAVRLGSEPGELDSDAGGERIDPGFVAQLVWTLVGDRMVIPEIKPYVEVNIERDAIGPIVSYGPQTPETI